MRKLFSVGLVILSVSACVLAIISMNSSNKIGFFDYNKVYNECKMKKDLEQDLQKVVSQRKSQLDSLQLELSFLSQAVEAKTASQDQLDKFEDMKERFLTLQNRYEEENIRLKETYFTQIRTKINEAARLYAEKNGFDYLFAAIGDGSLMYGAESEDVTKSLQEYLDHQQ